MRKYQILFIFLASLFQATCQTSDEIGDSKLNCYLKNLRELKTKNIYREIFKQFRDTFPQMRQQDKFDFGDSSRVKNEIDDALFLNKDSTECLLIVLEKNENGLVFGSARVVRGAYLNSKWNFNPSRYYSFENDYYKKYDKNDFENISSLAKAAVLTDGNFKKSGCEIDQDYWFRQLKE